jgi:uncharacterized protein (TIGR00369 family)
MPMTPTSHLEAWLAQEAQVRARMDRGVGPGVATLKQLLASSGLQLLQGMLQGEVPYASMARTLDFMLVDVGEGCAVFQGTPGEAHLNPTGTIHGGWYASLLDSAMACAIHTRLPAGRGYTTTAMNVSLVRGIGATTRRVRAEGQVIHLGKQMGTAEARLFGPDGTLYAHATSTCLIFDLKLP